MKTGQGEAISLMQCGANYQCMPLDPEYTLPFCRGVDGYSYMYGAEYEFPGGHT